MRQAFTRWFYFIFYGYNTILTPPPPCHNSHHGNRRKWLLSTGLNKGQFMACLLKKVAVEESWLLWTDGLQWRLLCITNSLVLSFILPFFLFHQIDFAFSVWKMFPDRLVGFPGRDHYWSGSKSQWMFSSKWSNRFSMILTSGAFYHK